MIRKFLFILVSLGVINSVAFGADASSSSTSSAATTSNQFVKGDYISTSGELKCRSLKEPSKYQTRIIGYDFINGIIKCEIIPKEKNSLEVPKTENANKKIIEQTFDKYLNKSWLDFVPLVKEVTNVKNALVGAKTTEIEVEKGSTLSSYLSGLAVLKDIDAENTAGMSETTSESAGLFTSEEITKTTSNVAAKLNQANIKYRNYVANAQGSAYKSYEMVA